MTLESNSRSEKLWPLSPLSFDNVTYSPFQLPSSQISNNYDPSWICGTTALPEIGAQAMTTPTRNNAITTPEAT